MSQSPCMSSISHFLPFTLLSVGPEWLFQNVNLIWTFSLQKSEKNQLTFKNLQWCSFWIKTNLILDMPYQVPAWSGWILLGSHLLLFSSGSPPFISPPSAQAFCQRAFACPSASSTLSPAPPVRAHCWDPDLAHWCVLWEAFLIAHSRFVAQCHNCQY